MRAMSYKDNWNRIYGKKEEAVQVAGGVSSIEAAAYF
jgi:hypothetical protein